MTVTRDISLKLPHRSYAEVAAVVGRIEPFYTLFDYWHDDTAMYMSFHLRLHAEHNMTKPEIDARVANVLTALQQIGAVQR